MDEIKSGHIRCNSADIYYEIYGEGEPIVFLHGNGEDMSYFKPQIKEFKEKHKLILIDSRGHGRSSHGDQKLSLYLMCDDVIEVLDKLNLPKVNLLGFSDGGNIALLIALKKPEIIKTLTVMGANLKPKDLNNKDMEEILVGYNNPAITKSQKELLELMINEPNIEAKDLEKINIPTLVIAGEHDAIKESCTRLIAASIKDSQLEIVKDADHCLSLNKPEVFNHIFLEFIHRK